MKKRSPILFLLVLGVIVAAQAQTVTERRLFTDGNDSLCLKILSYDLCYAFDRNGNYGFKVKKNDLHYFITETDTLGPFKEYGGTYSRNGGISTFQKESASSTFWYMNEKGTTLYGPAVGVRQGHQTSDTRNHIAVTTVHKDTAHFYINNQLVYSALLTELKQIKLSEGDWVAFSENGNVLYYLEQNGKINLYKNGEKIDSSDFLYSNLAINDNGDYLFAKGFRPDPPIEKYNYAFYVHTQDTAFDYVRTVWQSVLTRTGGYYTSGNDNGSDYIIINGVLHKNIDKIADKTILDKRNSLFCYERDSRKYLNVNGKDHPCHFDKIFEPTMDANGHFAYYGLKNYYLYKVVDDLTDPQPLSRYGVRAQPLYISPGGSSLHYFKTDDSIYFYKDNDLIFNPIPKNQPFLVLAEGFLPTRTPYWNPKNGHSLFSIRYGDHSYIAYDGNLSKPLEPISEHYGGEYKIGNLMAGEFNEHGFYVIQKIGEKKFLIIINNLIYKEIDDLDHIVKEHVYFDGKTLVFYAVKGMSFYQYTITL